MVKTLAKNLVKNRDVSGLRGYIMTYYEVVSVNSVIMGLKVGFSG